MKKTLIALAALASTAAFAQSSVTISGRLDLGHGNTKVTNTTGGVTTSTVKTSSLAGDEGTRTGSRITFSGVEDLGGGLKASFNYEARLRPDNTGADGDGIGGTRNAFLALSGGFGAVQVGTFLNSVDVLRGYSATTAGAPGGDFLADHAGLSGRSTNAIAYRSPDFGGVVVSVGLTNESTKTTNGAGAVTAQGKTSGNSVAATYNAGPLSVHAVAASGKATTGPAAGTTGKQSTNGFAVSYDIGMAKPYFAYETGKTTPSTAAAGTNVKYNAWELGATFPMGAFTPYVAFGSGKIKEATTGVTVVDTTKTSAFQVGTLYALSKRTYVYGAVGQTKAKDTTAGLAAANIGAVKESGYKLGLVHQF